LHCVQNFFSHFYNKISTNHSPPLNANLTSGFNFWFGDPGLTHQTSRNLAILAVKLR